MDSSFQIDMLVSCSGTSCLSDKSLNRPVLAEAAGGAGSCSRKLGFALNSSALRSSMSETGHNVHSLGF